MAQAKPRRKVRTRRSYSEEFKQEAVQLLLDGHSAPSVAERLGLTGPNVLDQGTIKRWMKRPGNEAKHLIPLRLAGFRP